MTKKNKLLKKIDYPLLAKKLDESKHVNNNGSIGFSDPWFNDYLSIFKFASDFPDDIYDTDQSSIAWKAVVSAAEKGIITDKTLRNELSKGISEYQKKPEQTYIMATSISARFHKYPKRFRFQDAYITITRELPNYFSRIRVINDHFLFL